MDLGVGLRASAQPTTIQHQSTELTPARVNDIVRGQRGITADTALRLAQYFNTDAQSWMNLQSNYELETTEQSFTATGIQPLVATA